MFCILIVEDDDMESITFGEANTQSLYGRTVIVSKEFVNELKNTFRSYIVQERIKQCFSSSQEVPYTITIPELFDLLEVIFREADWSLGNMALNLPEIPLLGKQNYLKAKEDYAAFRKPSQEEMDNPHTMQTNDFLEQLQISLFQGEDVPLEEIIRKAMNIYATSQYLYQFRETLKVIDSTLESFSLMDEEADLSSYQERIRDCVSKNDLKGVQAVLKDLQIPLLEHWKEYVTDINAYEPGKPFRFLCHSTSRVDYDKEFDTRFVSTSLLTEDLTETYRSGFGFILPPDAIVAAAGCDMYIRNETDDVDSLGTVSLVTKLDGPEKVVKECLERKRKVQREKKNESVYSEVVVDGFHPVAIFCLTDGGKEFNYNYCQAKKLQEKFPHLKIIELDMTLYHENSMEDSCRSLVEKIEQKRTGEYREENEYYCSRLTRFWNSFMELKKKGSYETSDIERLYFENKELVVSYIPPEDLFRKGYDEETIRYILYNNFRYNIKGILEGPVNSYQLDSLYRMLANVNDCNTLNYLVPHLGSFLSLYPHISMSEEILETMRTFPSETFFEDATKLLQAELQKLEVSKTSALDDCLKRQALLTREIAEKEDYLGRLRRYDELRGKEYLYSISHSEIERLTDEKKEAQGEVQQLEEKYQGLEMTRLAREKEKTSLEKTRILHRKRLMEIQMELDSLEFSIHFNQDQLKMVKDHLGWIEDALASTTASFQAEMGVDIHSYPEKLAEAKVALEGADIWEETFALQNMQESLAALEQQIQKLREEVSELKGIGEIENDSHIDIKHSK